MNILETRDLKRYYGSGNTLVARAGRRQLFCGEGRNDGYRGGFRKRKVHAAEPELARWIRHVRGNYYSGPAPVQAEPKGAFGFRRRFIGFVFRATTLLPVLNGYDNITLPSTFERGKKTDHAFVEEIMETLHITDQAGKMPSQMSGGQQQRIAIARAW